MLPISPYAMRCLPRRRRYDIAALRDYDMNILYYYYSSGVRA